MPGKQSNDNNRKPPCSLSVSETGLFVRKEKSKLKSNILRNLQNTEESVDRIIDILKDILNEGGENTAPKNG